MTRHDAGRGARIMEFIQVWQSAHGYPPSVREIARAVGLASTSAVHHHLRLLRQSGLVNWTEGQTRSLRLVGFVANEAEDILFAVMLDRRVAELDPQTQDRIGRYFAGRVPRRDAA